MGQVLRVLLVEDSALDAALLLRELRRGYAVICERVETPEAMAAALSQQPWDLLISDNDLPRFSGLQALQLALAHGLDLPLLIVSGHDDEATALAAMRAGAHDYFVKGQFERLLPAVERELREAEQRRARRAAEAALQQAYHHTANLLENMTDAFYAVDAEWRFTYINRTAEELWGRQRTELLGRVLWDEFPQTVGSEPARQKLRAMQERIVLDFETISPISGRWIRMNVFPINSGLGVYFRDITARKQAETELRASQTTLQSFYDSSPLLMGVVEVEGDQVLHVYDNTATERYYGVPAGATRERTAGDLGVPAGVLGTWLAHLRHCHQTGAPLSFEHVIPTAAGPRWLAATIALLGRGPTGRPRFSYVAEDVTERKQAEQALRQARQAAEEAARRAEVEAERAARESNRLARLQSLTAALSQAITPQHVAEAVVPLGLQAVGADAGIIWRLGPDGAWLEVTAAFGYPDELLRELARIPVQVTDPAGKALATGQAVWLGSLAEFAAYSSHMDAIRGRFAYEAAVFIPLIAGNQGIGVLAFSFAGQRTFEEDERSLLLTVGWQCAQALERARLYEAERRAKMELEARVAARTAELQAANTTLQQAIAQRQRVEAQLDRSREDERARIARELHDELGSLLTALKMDLAWLGRRLPAEPGELRDKARDVLDMVDTTVEAVRDLATQLRPSIIDDLGLLAAIDWLVQDFQVRTDVDASLALPAEPPPLDDDRALALFRTLQEALTNVARHAEARSVAVSLEPAGEALRLRVRDDGRGFDPAAVRPGQVSSLGLLGIRERAQRLGGSLEVRSAPGQGCEIEVVVPLGNGQNQKNQAAAGG